MADCTAEDVSRVMRIVPACRAVVVPAAICVLLACAGCQPAMKGQREMRDQCNAKRYQELVGTLASHTDFSGEDMVRIIPPGSVVTLDYRPDRLNVETDHAGRITRLYCG